LRSQQSKYWHGAGDARLANPFETDHDRSFP
jgi:hypothetical protein